MSKLKEAAEAVAKISNGSTVMIGGFGRVGVPYALITAVAETGVRDLTVISNNMTEPGVGIGLLIRNRQVRKAIASFFTTNPEAIAQAQAGEIELELLPQGTLAEAIRAGGSGLGGFYTPTAAGTALAEGREVREIDGRKYVLQKPLVADVALIRAHKADELGNLVYRKTGRNFNPMMATAAKLVICEVDDVVPLGTLDPESVVTPHLYVDAIIQSPPSERLLNAG
jgi:3-oxoacid CoA-transferase A subunit